MGVFIRTVRTKSGATAVQIVTKHGKKIIDVIHIGSAHTDEELAFLKHAAQKQLLHPGQQAFNLDWSASPETGPEPGSEPAAGLRQPALLGEFETTPPPAPRARPASKPSAQAPAAGSATVERTSATVLWNTLSAVYDQLGFNEIHDETFKKLVLARIIEPTSKEDSIRVINALGITAPSHATIHRTLARCITRDYQNTLSTCAFHYACGGLALLLYDVSTLYFEAQKEDEFRKPGMSKERRLDPQIVIGILVDQNGFPLELHSFEGNKSEIKTMIPVIEAFLERHGLTGVTIVADAGMMSAANIIAMENHGFTFIVGSRISKLPEIIETHLDSLVAKDLQVEDQKIFEDDKQVSVGRGASKVIRTYRVVFQYRAKRAALDLRNIDKQIEKSKATLAGTRPKKKDKYVKTVDENTMLDHELIDAHRRRAGFKGYVTNLGKEQVTGAAVIAAYHDLFQVERSFRMSKSDLRGRPIFHRKKDSIQAHLSVVFAALAVSRVVQERTGLSLRRVLNVLKELRSAVVNVGGGQKLVLDPVIPVEAREILDALEGVH